ncbi:MAG: hypothetical protein ACSLFB_11770 [Acidimicrobiales bacterium]
MSDKIRDDAAEPTIATKAELLKRLRNRERPGLNVHLTPAGPIAQQIQKDSAGENERRIERLRSSLYNAHDAIELQHSFSRLDGYAVARFSKER